MTQPYITPSDPSTHGDVLTAISNGLVALLEELFERGPTRARSYYEGDLVVCVMRGGCSRVDETVFDGGHGAAVIRQHMEFQDIMRARLTAVIKGATGRPVIDFMSGNQQQPDLMCGVFILGPTDLIDTSELPNRSGGSAVST